MNVLVTGHSGFIGSHLYRALLADGHYVLGWDDVRNPSSITMAVSQADVIFHLGARVNTLEQDVNRIMFENYHITKILVDEAEENGAKVVFASSAATYGVSGTPANAYGWSKYCAEQYGLKACSRFVSLRYFNVYGPGEGHKGAMASVATQSMQKGSFTLFPGKPSRDFVYVFDVVNANIWAMENIEHGVYEVGSGESRTFEDVLSILGIPFDYHDASSIPHGYQMRTQSDCEQWMPGWSPRYTLESGLTEYLRSP